MLKACIEARKHSQVKHVGTRGEFPGGLVRFQQQNPRHTRRETLSRVLMHAAFRRIRYRPGQAAPGNCLPTTSIVEVGAASPLFFRL